MIDGLAVVDKPAGWTSHDVVARLRKTLGERRIGHAGTLDPDATGVLLVGVGRTTRLLRFLTALPKEYTGEVVFGIETNTLDDSGEIVARHEVGDLPIEKVRAAAAQLTGPLEQVPPMVSAVKVGGRRLHELARAGLEVERAARPVVVHQFEVTPGPVEETGVVRIRVSCSSGTYVRVLAADLGRLLGGGAHLRRLRRVAVGSFTEDQTRPIEAISAETLLRPAAVMRDYAAVRVDGDIATAVGHGRVLPVGELGVVGDGPWAVLDGDGALLAVYERHAGETVKPAVVIAT